MFLADYNGKLLYNFNPINSRIIKNFDMEMLTPILNEQLIAYAPKIHTNYKYVEKINVGKLPFRELLVKSGTDSLISKE